MTVLLAAHKLTHAYGSTQVLTEVSVAIAPGEVVSIMGPSGSGKSTLLRLMAGIEVPGSGNVLFEGTDLSTIGDKARSRMRLEHMGFVFQSSDLIPELTLRENVSLPRELLGERRRDAQARADELLRRFGIDDETSRRISGAVSGGQAQRAAVARALAGRPSVVFADEPTGSLDSANGAAVMDALLQARDGGTAVVLVTHDPQIASRADRVVSLCDGHVVSSTPSPARSRSQKSARPPVQA